MFFIIIIEFYLNPALSLKKATVAGFGDTSEDDGSGSPTLKKVDVQITTCNRDDYAAHGYTITDMMICAGSRAFDKDSCLGDSGGPLVTKQNGRYEVSGVVSFGHGCARPPFPGVYASSYALLGWIKSTTRSGECPRG